VRVVVGICLCRGPSRTPVHHVRCYVPPSRSWSFGFKLSLSSFAFRVCMCLCVRVRVRVLLQMRLWACPSHVSAYRCAVRFSFSAAAAPAHTLRAPLLASSPLLVLKRLPVTHRWASNGSVGPNSHSSSLCVGTLALFAGDRRARAIQGIISSTTKRVRRPVLPPTLQSCGSLSMSFGPSPSSPLERLVLGLVVRVCVPSKACASPLAERCSSPACVCVASRWGVVHSVQRFSFS
jgi:hypothetical protein